MNAEPSQRPAAIILAAGASSRMGSPKPLLKLGGETFADRLIRVFGAHCDPVILVLGHHAAAVERGLKRHGEAAVVRNPDPDRGQTSSLQTGIAACAGSDFLFSPVDAPAVSEGTVAMLVARWRRRTGSEWIFRPRHEGRRGHPVLVCGPVARQLAALDPGEPARETIRAHRAETVFVDVDDAGILSDVDEPDEYRTLAAEWAGGR
ncbi:MAG: nucleotidyltransferase family protein [Bryobacteraceae bacterium]